MAWTDPLTANLLDLLFELRKHPVPLTIGGGFGLYSSLREHTLFRPEFPVSDFLAVLREIFHA